MVNAVTQFEPAVDLIVAGDQEQLNLLLQLHPELIHTRSTRAHRATLLHYVAANGVEEERQKTPANIVEITELLLQAGAAVDAEANLYGGGATTLALAATSVHPEAAGVQIALLDLLLEHGASLAPQSNAANSGSLIESCLANGRRQAAEFFASRGAPITLASAAGLGRIDRLRSYFELDSASTPATEDLEQAFFWACQYGRLEAAQFLLENGASLTAADRNAQTPLHHAIIGGNVEMVNWLLSQNAPLDARNRYGGAPLGQARWSAANGGDDEAYRAIIASLLKAGTPSQKS